MGKAQTTSPADVLSRAGIDLHLEVSGTRIRAGLTAALRESVRSGRLAPGARLPSSRALAEDLGIARSTVTECYTELVEEGWLTAQHGSGTRVAQSAMPHDARGADRPTRPAPRRHGLEPGAADYADFPRKAWMAAARRALTNAPHSAFGYGDPLGRIELRTALVEYLARARGVQTTPERIIVTSGYHHALGIVAQALRSRGATTVAVEGYGLDIYRGVLTDAGLSLPPIPVDRDGARVGELETMPDAGAAVLTPAHQFPTGHALSSERRAAAVDWARRTDAVILEDDYDGEFRYDRKPIGALQSLDPDHVIYLGTASKSVAPALRLGWAAVPAHLLDDVGRAKGRVDTVSALDQLIFTEFLSSGAFDRHVRGRRQSHRHRRDELITALDSPGRETRIVGMPAGLQATLLLPAGTEAWMREAALHQGLQVSGLSEFRHPDLAAADDWGDGLVVNFASISDSAWEGALRSLMRILP